MGNRGIIVFSLYCVVLTLMLSTHAKYINFVLQPRKTECFYHEIRENDFIHIGVLVGDESSKIAFAIFDPNSKLIEKYLDASDLTLRAPANITGAYRFCFSGGMLLASTVIYFDYDAGVDSLDMEEIEESEGSNEFSNEKKEFISRIRQQLDASEEIGKPVNRKDAAAVLQFVHELRAKEAADQKDKTLDSLVYLSVLADRMNGFLDNHKIKIRKHYNIQTWNLFQVDAFSGVISCGIIFSGCIQMMLIKYFFTGSFSWKIWQF